MKFKRLDNQQPSYQKEINIKEIVEGLLILKKDMIKAKIQKLVDNKIKLINSRFSEIELNLIYDKTKFIEESTIGERCYNILNDISELVTCKQCKINKPKFLRISTGYRQFCSDSCKNIWIYDNSDTKKKISASVSKYHSTVHNTERRRQQNKRIKTMSDRGHITHPSVRPDFVNYMKEVWRYTNENDLTTLPNHDKRGRIEIPGTYQLDHKYSIFQGFVDNISPEIIGNINNLEFIPSIENSKKKNKCSISIEELTNSYK